MYMEHAQGAMRRNSRVRENKPTGVKSQKPYAPVSLRDLFLIIVLRQVSANLYMAHAMSKNRHLLPLGGRSRVNRRVTFVAFWVVPNRLLWDSRRLVPRDRMFPSPFALSFAFWVGVMEFPACPAACPGGSRWCLELNHPDSD